jgi:hypothetical protein
MGPSSGFGPIMVVYSIPSHFSVVYTDPIISDGVQCTLSFSDVVHCTYHFLIEHIIPSF